MIFILCHHKLLVARHSEHTKQHTMAKLYESFNNIPTINHGIDYCLASLPLVVAVALAVSGCELGAASVAVALA